MECLLLVQRMLTHHLQCKRCEGVLCGGVHNPHCCCCCCKTVRGDWEAGVAALGDGVVVRDVCGPGSVGGVPVAGARSVVETPLQQSMCEVCFLLV